MTLALVLLGGLGCLAIACVLYWRWDAKQEAGKELQRRREQR